MKLHSKSVLPYATEASRLTGDLPGGRLRKVLRQQAEGSNKAGGHQESANVLAACDWRKDRISKDGKQDGKTASKGEIPGETCKG